MLKVMIGHITDQCWAETLELDFVLNPGLTKYVFFIKKILYILEMYIWSQINSTSVYSDI